MTNNVLLEKQPRIARPVRVWNLHSEDFVGKSKDNITRTVPAHGYIVVDRNEANYFLAVSSPRWDSEGNVTPKALIYCCDLCCSCKIDPARGHSTQYPPKLHKCFVDNIARLGLAEGIEPCGLCGKKDFETIAQSEAHAAQHAGGIYKDPEYRGQQAKDTAAPSADVLALKAEVQTLKDILAGIVQPLLGVAAQAIKAPATESLAPDEVPPDTGPGEEDIAHYGGIEMPEPRPVTTDVYTEGCYGCEHNGNPLQHVKECPKSKHYKG